jgi:hypothetical protein
MMESNYFDESQHQELTSNQPLLDFTDFCLFRDSSVPPLDASAWKIDASLKKAVG